jgi:hypothetical protein
MGFWLKSLGIVFIEDSYENWVLWVHSTIISSKSLLISIELHNNKGVRKLPYCRNCGNFVDGNYCSNCGVKEGHTKEKSKSLFHTLKVGKIEGNPKLIAIVGIIIIFISASLPFWTIESWDTNYYGQRINYEKETMNMIDTPLGIIGVVFAVIGLILIIGNINKNLIVSLILSIIILILGWMIISSPFLNQEASIYGSTIRMETHSGPYVLFLGSFIWFIGVIASIYQYRGSVQSTYVSVGDYEYQKENQIISKIEKEEQITEPDFLEINCFNCNHSFFVEITDDTAFIVECPSCHTEVEYAINS